MSKPQLRPKTLFRIPQTLVNVFGLCRLQRLASLKRQGNQPDGPSFGRGQFWRGPDRGYMRGDWRNQLGQIVGHPRAVGQIG